MSSMNTRRWIETMQSIILDGHATAPRGQETVEGIGIQQTFDMSCPVLICKDRKLNTNFMIAEAAWILSGSNDIAFPAEYMRKYRDYSDNGVVMNGAYGPAYYRQRAYVVNTLVEDPTSRQAIITIWDERPEPSKDIPCTVSVQFILRGYQLHCVANMRSSDVFLGLPYDIFTFSMMAADVLRALEDKMGSHLELGYLIWNAGSAHIYERDLSKAMACIDGFNAAKLDEAPLYPTQHSGSVEYHLKAILAGESVNWVVGDE